MAISALPVMGDNLGWVPFCYFVASQPVCSRHSCCRLLVFTIRQTGALLSLSLLVSLTSAGGGYSYLPLIFPCCWDGHAVMAVMPQFIAVTTPHWTLAGALQPWSAITWISLIVAYRLGWQVQMQVVDGTQMMSVVNEISLVSCETCPLLALQLHY